MKVIATDNGFYGRYISKGDTFEVPAGMKGSWFAPATKRSAPQGAETSPGERADYDKAADLV